MTKTDFPCLSAMHRAACDRLGPLTALRYKRDGLWSNTLSWTEYRSQADDIAAGLIGIGVKAGDRVAILAENRWEWLVSDHAVLSTGAIDVPIHSPSTSAQIEYQLQHSGAVGIIVSSAAQWEKVAAVLPQVPNLKFVVCFEELLPSTKINSYSLSGLRQAGHSAGEAGRREIAAREAATTPDSIATIIYTSGTTNRPKGVMLTHGNLLTNSLSGADAYGSDCSRVWLNWLPFSHVFARLVDHYLTTRIGICVALAQSANTVMEDIRFIQPTYFSSVPRLLEKVWAHLASLPVEARAVEAKKMFGQRLIHISSGGAPLPSHVANDLRDAGVIVLEGYGLTESSPVISFNERDRWKVGTVGVPIPGVEVRIADDGEILTRGPHVMKGYWNDPKATAEAIQDGWLYTGDLGSIDSDGFLSITGRKKDLIVTSGGKNIPPAALEAILTGDRFIEQALVYGDARPFVVAILVPKFELMDEVVRESGGVFTTTGEVVTDPKLIAWYQDRVNAAMKVVSQVERVKKIVILNHPLSIDQDEVTVTQKIRRAAVFRRFQSYLDALYQGPSE